MGGSSKSDSSNTNNYTTTSTSGTAAASGDNTGTMISGVNGSTITVTDNGAVNAALSAMFNVTDEALDFGSSALQSNENVIDKALNFVQGATSSALDVAKNLSLDSDAATARETNKNMMYTTIAIAVALGILAMKGK